MRSGGLPSSLWQKVIVTMRAMIMEHVVSLDEDPQPLRMVELPKPAPRAAEILVRVEACGVCHTELDEIEGRACPERLPVVLGHEVVGIVAECGPQVSQWQPGDRVGVGWIHCSTGADDENLSRQFRATGRDANGGYAEFMTVPQQYAYAIPPVYQPAEAAPLLCAGAIGYRALRLAHVRDSDSLGLTGFGGSAHLVLQLARHLYPSSEIYVFARDKAAREFALELGAVWAGDTCDRAPRRLHAIIDTTPAWRPVVEAMHNLRAGGRLVINAIRKEDADKSALLDLSYHEDLWLEREIKSVANITARDIADFLPIAAEIPIRPKVQKYPLDQANRALCELKRGPVQGAKVLVLDAHAKGEMESVHR